MSFFKVIEKYSNLIKTKDGKRLLGNFLSLSALQVISYIFPLFTYPYLAKVIGIEKFGEIAFATAVILYFQYFVDWGFNYTATRDLARCRDDKEKASIIYSKVFWSRVLLCCIAFVILSILIYLIPVFESIYLLLLFRFIVILGYILYSDWLFQAIEKMKYMTILNVFSNIIFTASIFLFIQEKADYIYQPLLMSLGFVIAGFISFVFFIPKQNIHLKIIPIKEIVHYIYDSFDVFMNQISSVIYEGVAVLLLGFYGGSIANGKYDAGSKVVKIISVLSNTISRVFFPLLSYKIEKHAFFAKLNIILSIFISILLFIGAPYIIEILFTPEFYDAIIVLRILTLSILPMTLVNVYGVNYLIQQGFERELRNLTVIVSILGIILMIPLVKYYTWIGAAVSITLIRILLGSVITIKALNIKKNSRHG